MARRTRRYARSNMPIKYFDPDLGVEIEFTGPDASKQLRAYVQATQSSPPAEETRPPRKKTRPPVQEEEEFVEEEEEEEEEEAPPPRRTRRLRTGVGARATSRPKAPDSRREDLQARRKARRRSSVGSKRKAELSFPSEDEFYELMYDIPESEPGEGKAYRGLFVLLGRARKIAPGINAWMARRLDQKKLAPYHNELLYYLGISGETAISILESLYGDFSEKYPDLFRITKSGFIRVKLGERDEDGDFIKAPIPPDVRQAAYEYVNTVLLEADRELLPLAADVKKWPLPSELAKKNPLVNWTAYPQQAYETYYRTNPKTEVMQPTDGGPYLPKMFPYGQGGRVYEYEEASSNPRRPRRSRKNRK